MTSEANILWLEWDGFYAPEMEGCPLAIVRDKVVLDSNRAARIKSVKPGIPVSQVRTLAPDCQVEAWREEDFAKKRGKWLDICTDYTGVIEPIDQHIAALDLSGHPDPFDIAERIVRNLTQRVVGVLRFGLASAKWIARLIAREISNGYLVYEPQTILTPFSVYELTPVSLEHRTRLEFLGYRTIGQVAQVPLEILKEQFNDQALIIYQAARGGCAETVRAQYPLGLLRECILFEAPILDWQTFQLALKDISQRIAARLQGQQSSKVELSIESEEGTCHRFARKFTKPITNLLSVHSSLNILMAEVAKEKALTTGYSALRVSLSDLEPIRERQHSLLDASLRPSAESALGYLKNSFGEQSVLLGSEIKVPRRELVIKEWRNATGWR